MSLPSQGIVELFAQRVVLGRFRRFPVLIYGRICEHRRTIGDPDSMYALRLVCRLDVNSLTPQRPDKAKE